MDSGARMKKLGAEIILSVMFIPFVVWVTSSLYAVQAKADRVVAIEEKIDYIYKYLLENGVKNESRTNQRNP